MIINPIVGFYIPITSHFFGFSRQLGDFLIPIGSGLRPFTYWRPWRSRPTCFASAVWWMPWARTGWNSTGAQPSGPTAHELINCFMMLRLRLKKFAQRGSKTERMNLLEAQVPSDFIAQSICPQSITKHHFFSTFPFGREGPRMTHPSTTQSGSKRALEFPRHHRIDSSNLLGPDSHSATICWVSCTNYDGHIVGKVSV